MENEVLKMGSSAGNSFKRRFYCSGVLCFLPGGDGANDADWLLVWLYNRRALGAGRNQEAGDRKRKWGVSGNAARYMGKAEK